jgi:hypothetical protein
MKPITAMNAFSRQESPVLLGGGALLGDDTSQPPRESDAAREAQPLSHCRGLGAAPPDPDGPASNGRMARFFCRRAPKAAL